MGYGRLRPSDPGGSEPQHLADEQQGDSVSASPTNKNRKKLIILVLLSSVLIIASAVCATLLIGFREGASGAAGSNIRRKPTQAISKACGKTRFPNLCVNSLMNFPGSLTATEQDLVHISFNMTLQHFSKALYQSSSISYIQMDPLARSAYEDCLELLEDSVDALTRSLFSVAPSQEGNGGEEIKAGSNQDVMTWLSAALTNQDTCSEGFDGASGDVKNQMAEKMRDLSELVSNCLSIFAASGGDDFSGVPIQNKRRLLVEEGNVDEENFPRWLGRKERELLNTPVAAIQADIIVSQDGNGTVKTITEAIKKAPEHSSRRIIIYVRAGR